MLKTPSPKASHTISASDIFKSRVKRGLSHPSTTSPRESSFISCSSTARRLDTTSLLFSADTWGMNNRKKNMDRYTLDGRQKPRAARFFYVRMQRKKTHRSTCSCGYRAHLEELELHNLSNSFFRREPTAHVRTRQEAPQPLSCIIR